MLFKVRKKGEDKIYKVFHVKTEFMMEYPEFLVFDEELQKWKWVFADETEPVE